MEFKMKRETNYQAIFFSGITFTGAGVAIGAGTGMPGLMVGMTGIGLIMMAIGLANRSQWPEKKNQDSDD
jgi:hypothetical protein